MVGQPGRSGGARSGSGRPSGKALKLGNATAWALVREGRTPLDVMLKNMIYWHDHTESVTREIEAMVVNLEDPDDIKAAMQLLARMLASREQAQKCAVDAAPYVHPRLAAITHEGPAQNKVKITLKIGDVPIQIETGSKKPFTVIDGAAPRVPVNDGDD